MTTPIKAAADKVFAKRVLARRRLLHFTTLTHPSYEAGWLHEDICTRLERFSQQVIARQSPRLMLLCPPRHGKLFADSTLVPTPSGMTTHGTLKPGDEVFGPDGRPTRVVAVSEKASADMLVTLTDGTSFRCHENHEWFVYERSRRWWIVRETRDLAARKLFSGGRAQFQLPLVGALSYFDADLPMDPYVLGAWLGDGSTTKPCITHAPADQAVIERIVERGYSVSTVCTHQTTGCLTTYFSGPRPNVSGRMSLELHALGLLKQEKRIPPIYLRSSVRQRLELLAGLVDTDGHVEADSGRVRFVSGSEELAKDVYELANSLGFRAYGTSQAPALSSSGIQGRKVVYTVGFQPTVQIPCVLPRKQLQRLAPQRRVGIKSIVRSPNGEQGHCIQVEREDGLYLVGERPTVTHNSQLASVRFPAWHLGHHPSHEIINVGYNLDLPMTFSRQVRELVRSAHYQAMFPDMELDPSSQSIEAWNTKKGGGFLAAGVGGGITGKGAHILIVDDPLKNQEDADNADLRKKLVDWYQSTAYTRLAPGGGVLLIQCMTGDTPVRLPDGTDRRLDSVKPGDEVATYCDGRLSTAKVVAHRSNGYDKVLAITTISGKVVRANGRHPFLVYDNGELKWIRARSLNTTHHVVSKDSAASGQVSSAQSKVVSCPSDAAGSAPRTTRKRNGPTGIARLGQTLKSAVLRISSAVMESLQKSTQLCSLHRAASAPFATESLGGNRPNTGSTSSVSITATTRRLFAGSSATSAISQSDSFALSAPHSPWPNTFDFTLDRVVSVEPCGEEEVFDVQIAETENFIANGLVSHNTCWNDADLAGYLQNMMKTDPDADQFEVVKYPALSEAWEYRDNTSYNIVRSDKELPPDPNLTLLRPIDTCLHEARYPTHALKRIKASGMATRIWSALYQQNPVPDEGVFFAKKDFRYTSQLPEPYGLRVYTAWDFAIGEKKQNDYTVGMTVLQDEHNRMYVLNVRRFRGTSFEIVEAMLDEAKIYAGMYNVDYLIGVEDGQIWKAMKPYFELRMSERKEYPSYEILVPYTDKLARARPLQGRLQQGLVYWPDPGNYPWVNQAVTEMLRFPAGANDDVVDAAAWAARMCATHSPPQTAAKPKLPSWRDRLNALDSGGATAMSA